MSDTKDVFTMTRALSNSFDQGRGLFFSGEVRPRDLYTLLHDMDAELRSDPQQHIKKLVRVAGQQTDGTVLIRPDLFLDAQCNEVTVKEKLCLGGGGGGSN
jgi:hypothetical protein